MHRSIVSPAAVAAVLAVVVVGAPVSAGGWSPPTEVGQFPAVDRPAIALHAGDVYLAVAGGPGSRGIRLVSNAGGSWQTTRVTSENDRQPAIAIAEDGTVHIAFSRRTTGCPAPCTLGIFHANNGSGDFVVHRVRQGDRVVHPSIGIDDNGRPWIQYRRGNTIWEANRYGTRRWVALALFSACCGPDPLAGPELVVWHFSRISTFREQFDGGGIILAITELDSSDRIVVTDADDAFDPDLMIDANDDWHIAYRRTGDGLWYARQGPHGSIQRRQVAAVEVGAPAIAELPNGAVIIVAATEDGILYRTNRSGEFTGGRITTNGTDHWPDVATTPDGKARVSFLRQFAPGLHSTPWLTRNPSP